MVRADGSRIVGSSRRPGYRHPTQLIDRAADRGRKLAPTDLPRSSRIPSRKPVFLGVHLGDVVVEVADRIALQRGARRLIALDIGQVPDAMELKTTVQGRALQARDRNLQRVEAVTVGKYACRRKATMTA